MVLVMLCVPFSRYGLAPNYGCCTANFNQGWPKFAQHVVMAHSSGEGLVVGMYAPASVQYKLQSGSEVSLDIVTDYPFNDTVQLSGQCGEGMTLSLRIPSWAQGATVQVNTTTPAQVSPGQPSRANISMCSLCQSVLSLQAHCTTLVAHGQPQWL